MNSNIPESKKDDTDIVKAGSDVTLTLTPSNKQTQNASDMSTVEMSRRISTTEFNWREYLSFAIIMACQVAAIQYYQAIANKCLGKSNHGVATTLVCQYVPQLIVNFTCPYWSRHISYAARMIVCSILFVANFAVMCYVFPITLSLQTEKIFVASRIVVMLCIVANAIAGVVTHITLLQYGAFYDKSCTNATSTGSGIGALIGAGWGYTIHVFSKQSYLSIGGCLLFPVCMFVTYFFVLPVSPAYTDQQNKKEEAEQPCDTHQYGTFKAIKLIYCHFVSYSLPLFLSYFLLEFMRAGLVTRIWESKSRPKFYTIYNFAFRFGSCMGKASTNFITIKKVWTLPVVIVTGTAVISFVYIFKSTSLSAFLIKATAGNWMVYLLLALPVGMAYGSTFSNTFYSIREEVTDKNLREFALGNIRRVTTDGQMLGIALSYLLK